MTVQASQHFTANAPAGADKGTLDNIDPRTLSPETMWMGFSLDSDPSEIRKAFQGRHGYPPAYVIQSGPVLLAGPIR